MRVLRGDPPFPKATSRRTPSAERPATRTAPRTGSRAWALSVLGLAAGATATEIQRAFRTLALVTHPDRGGEDAAFIDAKRACDVALAAARAPQRPRRRRR